MVLIAGIILSASTAGVFGQVQGSRGSACGCRYVGQRHHYRRGVTSHQVCSSPGRACRDRQCGSSRWPVGFCPRRKNTHVDPTTGRQTAITAGPRSTQAKPPCQCLKSSPDYSLRLLAELTVKSRVIMRIHAAFENFCIVGSVKESRRDAQRANPVTSSPSGTNFVGLAMHVSAQRSE
jgi:hypothetical protein